MDIKNRITEEVYFVTDTVVDWDKRGMRVEE